MGTSLQDRSWFAFAAEIAADLSSGKIVFPTSFDITIRLRELLRSETVGAAEITRAVSADPLLSARLVQVANSAAHAGAGKPISDIRAAIVRLGLEQVRNLASAVAMAQMVTYKKMLPFREIGQQMLEHCRWVAATAVILAREHSSIAAGEAYFTGLIHDIGVFYLLYRLSERPELYNGIEELHALLNDWHGQIGHAVLASLEVPEAIQQAIADHDEPRPVLAIAQLSDLIYVANILAQEIPAVRAPILAGCAPKSLAGVERIETYRSTVAAARDEIAQLARAFA